MSEFTDQSLSLYTGTGERKYVNHAERQRVLAVMQRLERERALFSLLLAWTGGRVSEVLAVRASSFQIQRNLVALRTLKRRRPHVREVPISPGLMAAIDRGFGLRELQADPETANRRLWRMSRVTAWRVVKGAMLEAGVVGRPACPRGLRHGFGVGTLQASVPLNLVQKWMGHAHISSTAIYADASGDEEVFFAEKFWQTAPKTQIRRRVRAGRKANYASSHRQGGKVIFNRLKQWARSIKRDAHAVYLAARDPRVPWYAKLLAIAVAAYALSPIDLIPDFVPVLGYLDDLIIVPLGILLVVSLIPKEIMAEHRETATAAVSRPVSRAGTVAIIVLWIALAAITAWCTYAWFSAREG